MLSLKFIQENPQWVIERLSVKQFDAKEIVSDLRDTWKEAMALSRKGK